MQPDLEQSLVVEYDELFALSDRLRQVADGARARLLAAGLQEPLEAEVFDRELELRGTGQSRLMIRLDSYHLEITGAPPQLQTHLVASILLDEAGVFRLGTVEMGLSLPVKARRDRPLHLVHQAFTSGDLLGTDPMLDRRFSMTWDWATPTTGYSFYAQDTEDQELYLSFKAREGYMTLPELEAGAWMAAQAVRFDTMVARFLTQLGWNR
jgi:hypothetical protein